MPLSAFTVRPESSENGGQAGVRGDRPRLKQRVVREVLPVSATSGASGNSSRPTSSPPNPASARMRLSSATLCAFRVASTTRRPAGGVRAIGVWGVPGSTVSPRELAATDRLGLQCYVLPPGQLRAAGRAQVEQAVQSVRENGSPSAVPWISTKSPVPVQTTFISGLGRRVLLVAEVEPGLTVDDPTEDRGRPRGDQRAALDACPGLR